MPLDTVGVWGIVGGVLMEMEMTMDQIFELRGFPETGGEKTEFYRLGNINVARNKAASFAKRINGPVDLAYDDGREWADRYITTASPSEYHAAGIRFERLD